MASGELIVCNDEAYDSQCDLTDGSAVLGHLSDQMPDHLYALTQGRRIYTCPWLREKPMRRYAASICLTATGLPFEISLPGRLVRYTACAVRPMVQRAIRADNVGIVSFQFEPSHPLFQRFRRIASPGALPLDRQQFAHLNPQLEAAYQGALNAQQAAALFDAVTTIAMRSLPRAKPIDSRVAKIIDLLREQHDYPLSELAARVGISYFRLSHLFAQNMGMTLRHYQLWRKLRKAIALSKHDYTLAQLAEASGFANAAHFSRAFVQLHAAPPSYFFQSGNVKIISPHK